MSRESQRRRMQFILVLICAGIVGSMLFFALYLLKLFYLEPSSTSWGCC
jgi:hypothetical protein